MMDERQQAINKIWKRLLLIFLVLLLVTAVVLNFAGPAKISLGVFIFGNFGGYIGFHRMLGNLRDDEILVFSNSWIAIIIPSFVGGLLAVVLYFLFLSELVRGDLFPEFVADKYRSIGADSIFDQHAKNGYPDYCKLLFWSFFAGFNQKYVINLIESVKSK